MMTVMLYGFLGQRFGRVHRYAVRSPAEAVRALSATLPGFRNALINGGGYRVSLGGKENLTLDRVWHPVSQRESIRIVPVVAGSRGLFQIILGAALIWAAPWVAGGGTGLFANAIAAGKIVGNIGISMVLGGVSQMLFAPPKPEGPTERPENKPSYTFDGAVNTAAQGNPVPVLYGQLIVGSQAISAGLTVEQIA